MSCWVAGDCVSHPACCAMVWVGFQSVRVSSPLYRGHTLKWSQGFFFRVARDAFGVSCGDVDRAARIPSLVSGWGGEAV